MSAPDPMAATRRVIALCGGASKLARVLRVSPSAVSHWLGRGVLPPARAVQIAQIAGLTMTDVVGVHAPTMTGET